MSLLLSAANLYFLLEVCFCSLVAYQCLLAFHASLIILLVLDYYMVSYA